MKTLKLLFLAVLFPAIAQAQFQLSATDIANSNFRIPVRMVDVTDGETGEPGLTPTCTRSINGAAFASCTGTITGIGEGNYYFTPAAAEQAPGFYVIKVADATSKTFWGTYRVSSGISDRDFALSQLTAESGTTLTLAANAVALDNQFVGSLLAVYDFTTKALEAKSCITSSANTGETVVTADDISGQITGAGGSADYYAIIPDAGCAARVSFMATNTLTAAAVAPDVASEIGGGGGTGVRKD